MPGDLRYFIDTVGIGEALHLTGWVFHRRAAIRALSLRTGGTSHCIPGRHGMPRPDVAAAFPDAVGSAGSGFIVHDVPLGEGAADLTLVLDLDDGRTVVEPLGHFHDGRFTVATRHFSGTITPLIRRPDLDFSYLEAILRVCAPAPRPIPRLDEPVLVIIPVYGGVQHLPPFFDSLVRHTAGHHRLAIVDDGNHDPEVRAILAAMPARHPGAMVLHRETNGGYVEAISTGFAAWRGEHVVVLNTDVVVPEGWLERLVRPLARDPRVASTTPFSNCASLCGFPFMPEDNPLYLGLDVDTIDRAFRRLDPEAAPLSLPTGVGFCMGMSRHALRRIGFIERETFGAGFGEENDWCQKAIRAGFVNRLVPDLFVYHKHGGSFPSEQKRRLMERNLRLIHERYPNYHADVAELILADPLADLRAFMAFLLAAEAHPSGALLALRDIGKDEGRPDDARTIGQPVITTDVPATALSWRYTFTSAHETFGLTGGNRAEIRELARRMRIGTVERKGTAATWIKLVA